MTKQLSAKTPTETEPVSWDFSSVTTAALSSFGVAKATITGSDPGAAGLTVGSLAATDQVVTGLASGGVNNCSYNMLCTVADADGGIYQLNAAITTTTDAA